MTERELDWTNEQRLGLIRTIAAIHYPSPIPRDEAQKIMFLSDMPARFLEKNKDKFELELKLYKAGMQVVEL